MRGKALGLMYDYFWRRFIQVVNGGEISSLKEIFSGVPQGAILSPDLWDFDIGEMETFLSAFAMLIAYADDCGLWYPITDQNKHTIVNQINADLESLVAWGHDNKTTFEPSKTHYTLISKKKKNKFNLCFPFERLVFGGALVKRKKAVKLVGYTFDETMSWSTMIGAMAKKARVRVGMLCKLRHVLDDDNMEKMYTSFIRPIMEYGAIQFMGAKEVHLAKLDAVQKAAERIGNFKVESLRSRREAAAVAFTLKLLDGAARGVLKKHIPKIITHKSNKDYDSRSGIKPLQLADRTNHDSLDLFKNSYLGQIHKIWARLPVSLLEKGERIGWRKISKVCKNIITGKTSYKSFNKVNSR